MNLLHVFYFCFAFHGLIDALSVYMFRNHRKL